MPEIKILTEAEIRDVISLDLDAVACVENAFQELASGSVVMPPILSMEIGDHHGEFDAKTAYVPGLDSFAFKMSTGFYGNAKIGLPSLSGLMVLFSARTGLVETVLLDNGYLTDVRTAAAGAVAARQFANADAKTAAILGTGLQARLQLCALTLVRPIKKAIIWGRNPGHASLAAAELTEQLGITVTADSDAQRTVAEADIIVTTTPSNAPILMADWLRPGQHVTAMGSDAHSKTELDPACLTRADLYVPDRLSQTRALGELRPAIEAGLFAEDVSFAEIGEVLCGTAPGRTAPDQITICDLTGTGVQDTAIATLAYERAIARGAGTTIVP